MKKLKKKSKMSSSSSKILIVGLGNPGEQYMGTPHNAGFLVVEQLVKNYELSIMNHGKLKSELAEKKIGKTKVILAKPQTFMNKSGEAVLALTKSYKLKAQSSLWLIHDDIDLALAQIKIIKNRGSAGHKGVEDIINKLKTQDFWRFRIGIRPKRLPANRTKTLMNKFVVGGFTPQESKIFVQTVAKCKDAVILALAEGPEKAASIYNQQK